jgi:hypothetical protein
MTQIRSLKLVVHAQDACATRRLPMAKVAIMMLPLRLSPRKRAATER